MAELRLQGLTKRFGEVVAVRDLTVTVESGELVALLGPSGCGKTTTLRMVAGFEAPTQGRVVLGGRDVTDDPPERRNCGMVFQHYALFPHLTVEQNVAFGLEMRRLPRSEVRRRVGEILERVGLTGLARRYPRQLSGGQQQRTALARALVINPSVLLLDEPLANLDAKLREEMRFYIRSLQREFGITTLYVTHDQAEALVLADRMATVAAFLGVTNLLPGRVVARRSDLVVLRTSAGIVRACGADGLAEGAEAVVSIRPEHIDLDRADAPGSRDGVNHLRGVVRERTFLGGLVDFRVDLGEGFLLRVQGRAGAPQRVGDQVSVLFDPQAAWALPAQETA